MSLPGIKKKWQPEREFRFVAFAGAFLCPAKLPALAIMPDSGFAQVTGDIGVFMLGRQFPAMAGKLRVIDGVTNLIHSAVISSCTFRFGVKKERDRRKAKRAQRLPPLLSAAQDHPAPAASCASRMAMASSEGALRMLFL